MANIRHGSRASVDDAVVLLDELGLRSFSIFANTSRQIGYYSNVGLSGGEMALIHLCRCILLKPKMIIFDDILSAIPEQVHSNIIESTQERIQYPIFISSSFVQSTERQILTLTSGE